MLQHLVSRWELEKTGSSWSNCLDNWKRAYRSSWNAITSQVCITQDKYKLSVARHGIHLIDGWLQGFKSVVAASVKKFKAANGIWHFIARYLLAVLWMRMHLFYDFESEETMWGRCKNLKMHDMAGPVSSISRIFVELNKRNVVRVARVPTQAPNKLLKAWMRQNKTAW